MDKSTLARCEINLYAHCARCVRTAFGILYYNEHNRNSHDSNHAHLTDFSDPDAALETVEAFYLSHGLTPRVFLSLIDGELERLRPYFARRGWKVEESGSLPKVMTLRDFRPPQTLPDGFDVIEMPRIDDELFALFTENDGGGDWNAIAAQDCIDCGSLTVFAARENGVKVGSVGIDRDAQTGLMLVQDVFISPRFRGRGYCAPMVAHAVRELRGRFPGEIYLWVENPIAQRVYGHLGFADVPFPTVFWRAEKPVR